MRCCDFLTVVSPRFISFAWRYLGSSAIRPRTASDAQPSDHPGVCCTGCSMPVVFEELAGSPKFPENPRDHSPCSQTPVGPDPRERTPCQRTRHGPRIRRRRRLATNRISGLSHTAFGLAVYASQWKLPATTQDSLPVAGPQALPDGIRTRRVPVKGLDHEHLLLSRVSWRNLVSFVCFCSKL